MVLWFARLATHVEDFMAHSGRPSLLLLVLYCTALSIAQTTVHVDQPITLPIFVNLYWDINWDADDPGIARGRQFPTAAGPLRPIHRCLQHERPHQALDMKCPAEVYQWWLFFQSEVHTLV